MFSVFFVSIIIVKIVLRISKNEHELVKIFTVRIEIKYVFFINIKPVLR